MRRPVTKRPSRSLSSRSGKPRMPIVSPRPKASAPAPTRTPRPDNNPKFDGIQKLKDAGLFEQYRAKFKADQQARRDQMRAQSGGKINFEKARQARLRLPTPPGPDGRAGTPSIPDYSRYSPKYSLKERLPKTPGTPSLRSLARNKAGSIAMPRFEKGGAVYEVNGRRVTKEQYEQASKKTDKAYKRAGEEMDSQKLDDSLEAFGKKARERNKLVPINKNIGGSVKKKPPGLYANIHAKRKRIASGSKEKMRKVGSKGAPTKAAFIRSAKTAKKG